MRREMRLSVRDLVASKRAVQARIWRRTQSGCSMVVRCFPAFATCRLQIVVTRRPRQTKAATHCARWCGGALLKAVFLRDGHHVRRVEPQPGQTSFTCKVRRYARTPGPAHLTSSSCNDIFCSCCFCRLVISMASRRVGLSNEDQGTDRREVRRIVQRGR